MKFKKYLYFSFLAFFYIKGYPQNRTADSLKRILQAENEDKGKVRVLLQLSSFFLDSSTEEAKKYGLQALEIAQRQKLEPERALALKNIGTAYYFQGNSAATLDYYGQSLRVYDSINDQESKARMLNNVGNVYYMNGTDDKALDNYFQSLYISEKISDNAGIATAYSQIAHVYQNKRATTVKALEFFLKAYFISEKIGDNNIVGAVCVNLGDVYSELNKDDSAIFYYYKSVKAYANTINIPVPLRGIGLVYAKKGDFENAIKYDEQSYRMAKQFDSKLAMAQALISLGDIHYKKEDYPSALKVYKEADSIARIIPANKELNDAYAGIAATYSRLGDFVNAYKYQKLFSNLSDTLSNQNLTDKLTALQSNFEIQTRQNQINLLTKDKAIQELDLRSQKIQKAFISAALILIFFISFIIYRNYRGKVQDQYYPG